MGEAIEALRPLVRTAFVTYVLRGRRRRDASMGLVTMRDLLFNEHGAQLADVMLREPLRLSPRSSLCRMR